MPETRTPLVAANWKMQKTVGEAEAFLAALTGRVSQLGAVDVVVCPPFTALAAATGIAAGSGIDICAHLFPQRVQRRGHRSQNCTKHCAVRR